MNEYFETGSITGAHGIKGDIRVYPVTEDPERFAQLDGLLIRRGDAVKSYEIERVRRHKQFVIIKLRGVDDMNAALSLKGGVCVIPREKALPLGEGEYYVPDLIGMAVYDTDGAALGILADVLQTGANDVYVIRAEQKKDMLIPAIKSCIKEVDIQSKIMTVELPEGL